MIERGMNLKLVVDLKMHSSQRGYALSYHWLIVVNACVSRLRSCVHLILNIAWFSLLNRLPEKISLPINGSIIRNKCRKYWLRFLAVFRCAC